MKIKELSKNDFFTMKPVDIPKASQVWIRGEYDRSQRLYECTRFDDISEVRYLKGTREVFVDFVF